MKIQVQISWVGQSTGEDQAIMTKVWLIPSRADYQTITKFEELHPNFCNKATDETTLPQCYILCPLNKCFGTLCLLCKFSSKHLDLENSLFNEVFLMAASARLQLGLRNFHPSQTFPVCSSPSWDPFQADHCIKAFDNSISFSPCCLFLHLYDRVKAIPMLQQWGCPKRKIFLGAWGELPYISEYLT